jgi:uncharacterized protein involved in outer membrane biogenesis
MKKILLAAAAVVLLVVVGVVAYGMHLAGTLNTPEFKKAVLDQAKAAVGTDVSVADMKIALLSGVTLKGIAVKNPAPFPGDLLSAEAFVLRYKLLPLLSGRVEAERLSLEKPSLALLMDAKGSFNYEKLGAKGGASKAAAPAPAAGPSVPLKIVLSKLAVDDASVTMTDNTKAKLLSVDDADFTSAFEVEGGVARGSGEARIQTVNLGDMLFVRGVSAPLAVSKQEMKLAPIRAKLAGGALSGDVTVHLEGGFRYVADVGLTGASVKTLIEEARSTGGVSGTLQGKARFEGTGGLPTMKGKGEAQVADCKVENAKVMALLSSALQVPELANPSFDECRLEFTISGSRVQTPVVSLKGDAMQLTGHGTYNMDTYAIDYDMSLALAAKLLAKVTRKELRPAFKDRGDGFSAVDFRVFGTTLAPQTDLLSRVGKAAATEAAKDQVNKLLKKKKLF